jgi:hypothetical protein
LGSGAYAPLTYFFVALSVAAFIVEAWALVDAVTRPAPAFAVAGKQTKPIWLIIRSTSSMSGRRCASSSAAVRPTMARTVPGKDQDQIL